MCGYEEGTIHLVFLEWVCVCGGCECVLLWVWFDVYVCCVVCVVGAICHGERRATNAALHVFCKWVKGFPHHLASISRSVWYAA